MQLQPLRTLFLLLALSLMNACANIVPPGGGPKDVTPPKLRTVLPADSQLNTRVTRIEMKFDEYITVSDVSKELHISPTLPTPPVMTGNGKTVILKIPDSLLQANTTYTISFGNAIKDLHEGNPYTARPYLFSTGAWFDSLRLRGNVYNAATGLVDSSAAVRVLLYDASLPEDVVSRQKPAYVVSTDRNGQFIFTGLPGRSFRIFALKETGDNLQFDNDEEFVAFTEHIIQPSIDTLPVVLTIFKEAPDSASKTPAAAAVPGNRSKFDSPAPGSSSTNMPALDAKTFIYTVKADTSDLRKRTVEINKPIELLFSRKLRAVHANRVTLSADSSGIEVPAPVTIIADSGTQKAQVSSSWQPNTVYTLRLLKGFATDTAGTETLPSKYIFRTKQDEDYGRMEIHVPTQYTGSRYLLRVLLGEADSIYLRPITDSTVILKYLSPGSYKIAIIADDNGDLKWTTGDLKKRRQPENVIPYDAPVLMKAGWEHVIDFGKKK